MNCSPVSCPIFLGHPEARGRCSQGERVLYGRGLYRSGGTGKAEAVKCVVCIPNTGPRAQEFGPSCAQENGARNRRLPNSVRIGTRPEPDRAYASQEADALELHRSRRATKKRESAKRVGFAVAEGHWFNSLALDHVASLNSERF
jgi:hypothetical protein